MDKFLVLGEVTTYGWKGKYNGNPSGKANSKYLFDGRKERGGGLTLLLSIFV